MDTVDQSPFVSISDMAKFTKVFNSYAFENANVQKFILSTDQHFDVIVNEEFFADSFLMFSHKFNAPTVTICMDIYSHVQTIFCYFLRNLQIVFFDRSFRNYELCRLSTWVADTA